MELDVVTPLSFGLSKMCLKCGGKLIELDVNVGGEKTIKKR